MVSDEAMHTSLREQQAKDLASIAKHEAEAEAYYETGKKPHPLPSYDGTGTLRVIFKPGTLTTVPDAEITSHIKTQGVLHKGTDADYDALVKSTLAKTPTK
jgi:hypothetical protein